MTIYASIHVINTPHVTGLSVDSGFNSLDQVAEMQPGKLIKRHRRYITYKITEAESLIFSDFPFYLGAGSGHESA